METPKAQPSKPKETPSQEQKVKLENSRRIMNSEKTTLPSLRNVEWRTVKTETNKINQVLLCISTNNITELNELIYAGAKLVCENFRIPSKSTKRKIKTKRGNSTGNADKKSTKTGQNEKNKKTLEYVGTKMKSQHEEK